MELRGIDFGRVLGASGVQGFFGEGYRIHKYWGPFAPRFSSMTFVAKTTTLHQRPGNMPLRDDHTPKSLIPKCVKVSWLKGVVLNSVGLSGPGAKALLDTGRWQQRERPFFLSFMSVEEAAQERLAELRGFVQLLEKQMVNFWAPLGLQINFSCPNVGVKPDHLLEEIEAGLDCAAELGIPLMPKVNLLLAPESAVQIADHPACDGLCVSNTLPWGAIPERLKWERLFGSEESPLAYLGGGGLSGKPLLPLLLEWIREAREAGMRKAINGGGGIISIKDARAVLAAGADSIFLGSIAILRPWRIKRIVETL